MFSSAMLLFTTMLLAFTSMEVEGKELERFSRKGKVVSEEADGNIAIELRRKRWGLPPLGGEFTKLAKTSQRDF